MSATWFETLFGLAEGSYDETKRNFRVEGDRLRSLANGKTLGIGEFRTPSLVELRNEGKAASLPGNLRLTHEEVGDVLTMHAEPDNRGALFQVASQFNCLEFATPQANPERGVTCYARDRTQGPACSLAAAAATVYRNYFAPVGPGEGQTAERQIDNLHDLAVALGGVGRFWEVVNGYTFSSTERLTALGQELERHDRQALLGHVRIGLHQNVEVTFARRFEPPEGERPIVSQALCAACSCAYSDVETETWEPLATLALDAAYEATLWAAVTNASHGGSKRVWLTFLGGGAFGNRPHWIANAIGRAAAALHDVDLDVRVAHYRQIDPAMKDIVEAAYMRYLGS